MTMEFPVCIEAETLAATPQSDDKLKKSLGNEGNVTMSLEMKGTCEKCGRQLDKTDEAYICSYECTFCVDCTQAMAAICPNCGGELVRRPRKGNVKSQ